MSNILIVGAGRFGYHMAQGFYEKGNDVMVVDILEDRINAVLPYTTAAQIGDVTHENFIESIGPDNFDLCIVAIEHNFQNSLEAASLLKEHGARRVLARAHNDTHAKFLLRNGADEVVFTEKEMAKRIVVRYSNDNIFDFIELTPEYSIYEIKVPSSWIGKTIIQKQIRSKYRINILATKEDGTVWPNPSPEHEFHEGETLIIMGSNDDVAKLV